MSFLSVGVNLFYRAYPTNGWGPDGHDSNIVGCPFTFGSLFFSVL